MPETNGRLDAEDVLKLRDRATTAQHKAAKAADSYRAGLAALTAVELRRLARFMGVSVSHEHRSKDALVERLSA